MHPDLWNAMLDADMNARYWPMLARRYSRAEVIVKVFLAVMSSGTVAAWGLWGAHQSLWRSLSAISALTAIASPILNFSKSVKTTSDLAGRWRMLLVDYEDIGRLDPSLSSPQAIKKFYSLKQREGKTKAGESGFHVVNSLRRKAFDEVKASRGLR